MVSVKYARAYTEVYEILNRLNKTELSKIPKEKIDFYYENRDKDYDFKVSPTVNLEEQNFLDETYGIITSLFMEYIASDSQKEVIDKILEHNQKVKEKEIREKYNPDEIFKNRKTNKIDVIEHNNLPIEVKKENLFQQIINYIKELFAKL